MAKFVECTFQGATIVLDGNEYDKCKFLQSRIVITRGNFTLKDSHFDGCAFEFGGEAENIKSLVLELLNQPKVPDLENSESNANVETEENG